MELLSPAGNFKKAVYAFHYGADAVYMGAGFSLRKSADNNLEDIKNVIEYAHNLGKKVYLASNIFFHNRQIDEFKQYLDKIVPLKPDALIVSDFAMVRYIHKMFPHIDIHVSTQASITNYETAQLVRDLGAKRIIPARELTLEETLEIQDKAGIQVELFCHGALCMSYSGRCMLSAYMTSGEVAAKKEKNKRLRDANQGDCAHPCRWEYTITEKTRDGEQFTVTEDDGIMKIFNSRDLCLIKRIPLLKKSGIASIKIEGRMKSAYYVAMTAMAYRECIDNGYNEKCYEELDNVSHRPFTEGFLMGDESVNEPVAEGGYARNTQLLGTVERVVEDGIYEIEVHNKITPEDELEIIGPDFYKVQLRKGDFKLLNSEKKEIPFAGLHSGLYLKTDSHLKPLFIIRKKTHADITG